MPITIFQLYSTRCTCSTLHQSAISFSACAAKSACLKRRVNNTALFMFLRIMDFDLQPFKPSDFSQDVQTRFAALRSSRLVHNYITLWYIVIETIPRKWTLSSSEILPVCALCEDSTKRMVSKRAPTWVYIVQREIRTI